ncbi:helix-turn-helix domain-containing protein [Mycobacterium servetii]|uniref:Helix-turn-helix domain-containing protein n=1 Tax=Mycobacterium servetii TaxID=3237418 RepID=A0ABV4C590_9MYCO
MAEPEATIADLVYQYRVERDWSRERLAEEMRKPSSWLSQVERGEVVLTDVTVLDRFAKLLGAPLGEFIQAALGGGPRVHGIIVDESQRSNADEGPDALHESIKYELQRYGVSDVLTLYANDDLGELMDSCSPADEVILIRSGRELIPSVVRLLTLRSVRLPSHFIVWDPNDNGRIAAARLACGDVLQINCSDPRDFDCELRKLSSTRNLHQYTVDELVANDAVRVGGSFAKSGVQKYFRKQAEGRGSVKLGDEKRFYGRLPEPLRRHYPKLLFSHEEGDAVCIGLDYVGYPNLRDLLLNLRITPERAASVLRKVLDYEYNEVYLGHLTETPSTYVQDYHFSRVWNRLGVTIDLDPGFAPLIESRCLQVNGRVIPNIPAMLFELERSGRAVAELAPPGVSPYIHGDLHLENILYDQESDKFWLVDPRGYPACDIYYDIGKLAHSYNGMYDLLHEGRHEVRHRVVNDTVVVDLGFRSPYLVGLYRRLKDSMQGVVEEVLGADFDEMDLKINFNEAMHFCSDMPFHINAEASPNVAVAIYATGALLLADVLGKLSIDLPFSSQFQHRGLSRMNDVNHDAWRLEG